MTRVEEAALKLAEKLDEIHAHDKFRAVWAIAQNHLGPYNGPTYEHELKELQDALGMAKIVRDRKEETEYERRRNEIASRKPGHAKD